MRHKYKYKELYGTIFYSDVPEKAKTLTGIDGAARTQMNLDKTMVLRDIVKSAGEDPL